MPNAFMNVDTNFPNFTSEQKDSEKIEIMKDYLYMLLEQLKYSLFNLDENNFNETGLDDIKDFIVKDTNGNVSELSIALAGITTRVASAEGNITTINQNADSLTTRVSSAEGDISTLTQTATDLTTRISDAEGDISTINQAADGIATRVSSAEGSITTLTQTADGLATRVTTTEGNISTLTQTASGLSSNISTLNWNLSTVSQTANKISWLVASGTSITSFTMTPQALQIISDNVSITAKNILISGSTYFSSLIYPGTTHINGSYIQTGTISADSINITNSAITGSYYYNGSTRSGGLEFALGNDGYGSTYGAKMYAYDGGLKDNYFIATDAGVRMTAAEQSTTPASIWCLAGSANIDASSILIGSSNLSESVSIRGTTSISGASLTISTTHTYIGGNIYVWDSNGWRSPIFTFE